MAWAAMSSVARAAITANAASAIESGSIALCACASLTRGDMELRHAAEHRSWLLISRSTAAASPGPVMELQPVRS